MCLLSIVLRFVILSEVIVSRSEAITQSKDPCKPGPLNPRCKAFSPNTSH
jgi:hypothetical protein